MSENLKESPQFEREDPPVTPNLNQDNNKDDHLNLNEKNNDNNKVMDTDQNKAINNSSGKTLADKNNDMESQNELTVQNFLSKNGDQKLLLEKRDDTLSCSRYISLAIFLYLLISPIFSMLKDAGGTAWVLALYVIPLVLLIWAFIEYWCRMECWFICICRGIILDMEKTNKAPRWLCSFPMYFVFFFMIVAAVLYAISYEPEEDENGETQEWKRYIGAALFLIGILFMISLTRDIVDVEGARRLVSLNEFIYYLGDVKVLEARGYKVVHYSQIGTFLKNKKEDSDFSWNEIFKLSHEPDPNGASRWNLSWGAEMSLILRKHKDKTD